MFGVYPLSVDLGVSYFVSQKQTHLHLQVQDTKPLKT